MKDFWQASLLWQEVKNAGCQTGEAQAQIPSPASPCVHHRVHADRVLRGAHMDRPIGSVRPPDHSDGRGRARSRRSRNVPRGRQGLHRFGDGGDRRSATGHRCRPAGSRQGHSGCGRCRRVRPADRRIVRHRHQDQRPKRRHEPRDQEAEEQGHLDHPHLHDPALDLRHHVRHVRGGAAVLRDLHPHHAEHRV